jgi:cytoskeletal protein CcmA (bactofilin family)
MALFGDKKAKNAANIAKSDKISSATIITSCMKVTGNLDGSDTIHIDGHVIGNITVNNTLVIGKSGMVEGDIEAKHVIINGELKGTIKCEHLEVMQTGKVSRYIEAKHLVLDGIIDGDITAHEDIKVLENANIHAVSLKSKTITVNGQIQGTVIASEILEIGKKGFVEGQITVKNIKTEEGGRMIGTMSTYDEKVQTPIAETSSSKKKKTDTKPVKNTKSKDEKEDDFFVEK